MSTPARVAAAAVIGVLAVGGALFMLGRPDQSDRRAGPSPTADHRPRSRRATDPIPDRPQRSVHRSVASANVARHLAGCTSRARCATADSVRITFTVPDGWAGAPIRRSGSLPRTIRLPTAPADLRPWTVGWTRPVLTATSRPADPVGRTDASTTSPPRSRRTATSTGRRPSTSRSAATPAKYLELQRPAHLDPPARDDILPVGRPGCTPRDRATMAPLDPRCRWRPRRRPGHTPTPGTSAPAPCRAPGDRGLDPDRSLIPRPHPATRLASSDPRRPVADVLRRPRQHPAQAPHPAPRARRLALRRGAVRRRGVHRPQLAALSRDSADADPQDRAGLDDRASRRPTTAITITG